MEIVSNPNGPKNLIQDGKEILWWGNTVYQQGNSRYFSSIIFVFADTKGAAAEKIIATVRKEVGNCSMRIYDQIQGTEGPYPVNVTV